MDFPSTSESSTSSRAEQGNISWMVRPLKNVYISNESYKILWYQKFLYPPQWIWQTNRETDRQKAHQEQQSTRRRNFIYRQTKLIESSFINKMHLPPAPRFMSIVMYVDISLSTAIHDHRIHLSTWDRTNLLLSRTRTKKAIYVFNEQHTSGISFVLLPLPRSCRVFTFPFCSNKTK